MKLNPGDKIPDITVNDQNGNPVNLRDVKGKKIVLYFYPKDQTPGCTAQACNLRDNYKLLLKQGYSVYGISTDSEKSHQKFIEKEKLPFPLLSDPDKKMHDAYGTWVEKSMYGRKYMGTARTTFIINEKGIIEEVIEKADTKNHTEQILATDKGMKKGKTATSK
jgi:peroxiredoxin Q/BCP